MYTESEWAGERELENKKAHTEKSACVSICSDTIE